MGMGKGAKLFQPMRLYQPKPKTTNSESKAPAATLHRTGTLLLSRVTDGRINEHSKTVASERGYAILLKSSS